MMNVHDVPSHDDSFVRTPNACLLELKGGTGGWIDIEDLEDTYNARCVLVIRLRDGLEIQEYDSLSRAVDPSNADAEIDWMRVIRLVQKCLGADNHCPNDAITDGLCLRHNHRPRVARELRHPSP